MTIRKGAVTLTNTKTFGYIRVSSKEQNEARQVDTMAQQGVHERDIYIDKASGKDTDRAQYQALKAVVRAGDTVIFDSITRMSRSMDDTKREYEWFVDHGVSLRFIAEPMLNTDASEKDDDVLKRAVSDIVLTVLAAFAEKERHDIRKRQAEGIAAARKRGKHLGRPRIAYATLSDEDKARFNAEYARWKDGAQTAAAMMQALDMKRTTFYKVVGEYESLHAAEVRN